MSEFARVFIRLSGKDKNITTKKGDFSVTLQYYTTHISLEASADS